MSSLKASITILALLLSPHAAAAAGDGPRRFMEIGAEECEYEMAVLDRLAINLGEEPTSQGGRADSTEDS